MAACKAKVPRHQEITSPSLRDTTAPVTVREQLLMAARHQLTSEIENALQLRNLPPNRWVKYFESRPGIWSRQGHSGMAFDTRRGSLLIFGSDTHGADWDNAVHEFQPRLKRWETHYAAVGPETYRVDEAGRPIAGTKALLPWAMHTYDAIEYHPGLDALIVTSTIEHNGRGLFSGLTGPFLAGARFASVEDALREGPKFFEQLMTAVGSEDGREIVLELEDLQRAGRLTRDPAEGHYKLK
jgi:hypothetical protein